MTDQQWTHDNTCPHCGAEDLGLPHEFRHVDTPTGSLFLDNENTILHTCGTMLFSDYALGSELLEQINEPAS